MTLKFAAERMTGQAVEVNTGALSEQLTKYASILAAQGALSAALTYLGQSNEVRKLIITAEMIIIKINNYSSSFFVWGSIYL